MITKLRFCFDYGGFCLWDDRGAVQHDNLPISNELKSELNYLCTEFNKSMNWNEPMSASIWSTEKWSHFFKTAYEVFGKLEIELNGKYELICNLEEDKRIYMND